MRHIRAPFRLGVRFASLRVSIYEVRIKAIVRKVLLEAAVSEPAAAGVVEADNTEYLFLLGEFGGACFRKSTKIGGPFLSLPFPRL
jgi:hypothetical protein